jgi:DNA-directed RNA polymerase alpha subunit
MPTSDSGSPGNWPKTSNPAQNALDHAGYKRLEDLRQVTEAEVLALHGMGPKALRILKAALQAKGLDFAPPKAAKIQDKAASAASNGDWPKLAAPAQRALANGGFKKLADLTQATEAEVMALHGLGPKALRTLTAALQARGLHFAQPKPAPSKKS